MKNFNIISMCGIDTIDGETSLMMRSVTGTLCIFSFQALFFNISSNIIHFLFLSFLFQYFLNRNIAFFFNIFSNVIYFLFSSFLFQYFLKRNIFSLFKLSFSIFSQT